MHTARKKRKLGNRAAKKVERANVGALLSNPLEERRFRVVLEVTFESLESPASVEAQIDDVFKETPFGMTDWVFESIEAVP